MNFNKDSYKLIENKDELLNRNKELYHYYLFMVIHYFIIYIMIFYLYYLIIHNIIHYKFHIFLCK